MESDTFSGVSTLGDTGTTGTRPDHLDPTGSVRRRRSVCLRRLRASEDQSPVYPVFRTGVPRSCDPRVHPGSR